MAKGKDPAALFYIATWLTATKEMPADCRGWYLNLILHQFDKGDLPDDIEELANLADVRFSEFERFKQVFKQVLEQKFKQNDKGRLENDTAKEIIQARETFKEKRSAAGRIGYFFKYIKRISSELGQDLYFLEFVKNHLDIEKVDTKDEQVLKQVLEELLKLYRNTNKNINKSFTGIGRILTEEEGKGESQILREVTEQPQPVKDPKQFPVPDDFNGLPELEMGKVKEYLRFAKNVDLADDGIKSIWELFKIKHLTGKKFYADDRAVYSHFLETLKFEKFDNPKKLNNAYTSRTSGTKPVPQINSAEQWGTL
jgi:hypothetical protein